jgi:hypothetical protein
MNPLSAPGVFKLLPLWLLPRAVFTPEFKAAQIVHVRPPTFLPVRA